MKPTEITGPRTIPAKDAERVLRQLPQWFGIESALVGYANDAARLPNFIAVAEDNLVGFITLREHNTASLEMSCLALLPEWHRSGVGSRLCGAVEEWWTGRGGKLVQVKTLGPSRANQNYGYSRAFYDALGYLPVEEFCDLWQGNPCLLLIKFVGNHDAA